jgi:DNA-binding NarL/FixJ family response regulator
VIGAKNARSRPPGTTVTVLVSDSHPGVRAALMAALETQPGIAVVGSADRLEDAVAAIRRHRPDVVLLDLAVVAHRGIAGVRELAAVRSAGARAGRVQIVPREV